LRDLADRRGPEPERLRTLDHAMACAACKRELDLLRAITESGDALAPARSRLMSPAVGVAAAAVLIIGIGISLATRQRSATEFRGTGDVQLVSPETSTSVPRL